MALASKSVVTAMGRLSVFRTFVGFIVLVVLFLWLLELNGHEDHNHSARIAVPTETTIDLTSKFALESVPETSGKYNLALPYGVMYSPLANANECKRFSQLVFDLRRIQELMPGAAVRLRSSSDCGVLDAVAALDWSTASTSKNKNKNKNKNGKPAKGPALQVIAGIELYGGDEFRKHVLAQLEDLHKWNHWDRIPMLVVGSLAAAGPEDQKEHKTTRDEAELDSNTHGPNTNTNTKENRTPNQDGDWSQVFTVADVVEAVRLTKTWLGEHGVYNVPVTTAEPLQSYICNERFNTALTRSEYRAEPSIRDLCEAVDVIGLVSEPYFNTALTAPQAGAAMERDVTLANYICSDEFIGSARQETSPEQPAEKPGYRKPVVVLETGWPSGSELGADIDARASSNNQRIAINSLLRSYNEQRKRVPVVLYEFDNSDWRDPGELSVEQYFGVAHLYAS